LSVRHVDEGWPWPYEIRLRPALDGRTLALTLQLSNRSDRPMPAGIGLHPWFVRPLEVRVPAAAVYRSNADSPPRPEPVDGTPRDLRSTTEPPSGLDATWTSLQEPSVELHWPLLGLAAQLVARTDSPVCVAIATPPDPDATAVEIQTHGPDGLRRLGNGEPDAMALLQPAAGMELRLELRVRRTDR
jgi:aldose 1-epimerase